MLRRLLNIASVVCLALCVALIGMWVRSYYDWDALHGYFAFNHMIRMESRSGRFLLASQIYDSMDRVTEEEREKGCVITHLPIANQNLFAFPRPVEWGNSWGFWANYNSWTTPTLTVPYWFLVLILGAMAMACRLKWPPQFTLRSLFIATTFLAVVLGMIAWLDYSWIGK
jgi:hypothetical protein